MPQLSGNQKSSSRDKLGVLRVISLATRNAKPDAGVA